MLLILPLWLSTIAGQEAFLCGARLGAALLSDDGTVQVHNRSALGMNCVRAVQRRRGASLVPEDVEVGAVRVSVTGWDGWVLEGLRVRHFLACNLVTSGLVVCQGKLRRIGIHEAANVPALDCSCDLNIPHFSCGLDSSVYILGSPSHFSGLSDAFSMLCSRQICCMHRI